MTIWGEVMLSNKKTNRQKKDISDNEKDLLSIYNDSEEYIIYEDNDDDESETYRIVFDDDNEIDEEIKEEIKEEIILDDESNDKSINSNIEVTSSEDIDNNIYDNEKEEEQTEKEERKSFLGYNTINKIINIIFIVILAVLLLVSIDVLLVGKFEVGPFFAIPVKKYNDGGSKAYYGLGYKVIKYNQKIGRRDKEIGNYSLKYNTTPIDVDSVDLAIEFTKDENSSYEKYFKKFVRVTGELTKVDYDNNKIKVSYLDEDGKYAIEIICSMATKKELVNNLELNKEVVFIGTVYDYDLHTDTKPTRLYIKNCFAEQ